MSDNTEKTANLVVASPTAHLAGSDQDRLGGEQHGLVEWISGSVVKRVDLDKLTSSATKATLQAAEVFQRGISSAIGDFEVSEITLSLAVTAEGDIGIATAGVQGSISLVYTRKAASP